MDNEKPKTNIVKIAVILLLVSGAVYAAIRYDIRSMTPAAIRDNIVSFGVWAPVVFVILYALRPLVLFPSSVFSLAGGMAFGSIYGDLYNYTGAILSAMLAFLIARYLGRDFAKKIIGKKAAGFERLMEKEGFTFLFYMRFFAPFDPLSYAAGLTGISFRHFLIATMIPIIPATFAFSNFGSSISQIKTIHDLLKPNFLVPLIILFVVMLIPLAVKISALQKQKN